MAKTVSINGISYPDVGSVQIPLSGGNGNATFFETSDASIDASKVLNGYAGYNATGKVVGTLTTPQVSQDSITKVLTVS